MNLQDVHILRYDLRDRRILKRAGRSDDVICFERAMGRLNPETWRAVQSLDLLHLNTTANGCGNLLGVILEILRNPLLRCEGIGVDIGEFHVRISIVPCRAVRHQRIPPLGSPAFRNAVALEHNVRDASFAQMIAHCNYDLAATDNDCVDFLNWHFRVLSGSVACFTEGLPDLIEGRGAGKLCFHIAVVSLRLNAWSE